MMKKYLCLAAMAACVLSLASCGGKGGATQAASETTAASGNAASGAETADKKDADIGNGVLNVYNWGEYIDPQVLDNFEKEYGVTINYSLFASNEEMYTKLLSGASYDILVPSDYMVERLIKEKMIQPIDKSIVTNLDVLTDGAKNLDCDPDNTYMVPYLWQTVGILYDTTKIDPAEVEEKGFSIYHDPKYAGHAYMYDSERDSFMMAFKALGYSANTENEDEIQEAFQWLREADKAVQPAYVTDEVIDAMANGEKWMAIVYSGDGCYISDMNDKLAYSEPKEGTNVCVDGMVIPANAKNPALANLFMNYILEYDNSKMISEEVGYTSVNDQVMKDLSGPGGAYEGNTAYIPRSGYEKDEFFHDNETLKKELSELWIKVKLHE